MKGARAKEKMTFSLPVDLAQEVRSVVAQGLFPSQNLLVAKALQREMRRIRAERLREEFEDAAKDPLFLRDIKHTGQAFRSADSETSRMVPDD